MQQQHQCPGCNTAVVPGSRFCGSCGTQLNWTIQQQAQTLKNEPQMNWFERHLNWTCVFAWLLWFSVNLYVDDPFGIAWWLSLAAAIFWLIVSGWVVKRKGRRLWWLLLSWVGSPLWLKNMNPVSQSLPTVRDEERAECLVYYEDEKTLQLLRKRVEQLFIKSLRRYEDAYFQARKGRREFWTSMDKIFKVREYMSHAATEIVNRKKAMRPAPSAASAMSSACLDAYLDYEALIDPSNIVAGSGYIRAMQRKRAKELLMKSQKSLRQVEKEEIAFIKRLRITRDEYQRIVDYASIAVDADEWFRKLEAECP